MPACLPGHSLQWGVAGVPCAALAVPCPGALTASSPCCIAGSSDQLHKGAVHFNRNKLRKQALYLVARQTKFRELLPHAEAKRAAELRRLEGTCEADKPALLVSMKEALQALAQGGWLLGASWCW